MLRLVLMSLAGGMIFAGFALPFFLVGNTGLFSGAVLVVLGATAFWMRRIENEKVARKWYALESTDDGGW